MLDLPAMLNPILSVEGIDVLFAWIATAFELTCDSGIHGLVGISSPIRKRATVFVILPHVGKLMHIAGAGFRPKKLFPKLVRLPTKFLSLVQQWCSFLWHHAEDTVGPNNITPQFGQIMFPFLFEFPVI